MNRAPSRSNETRASLDAMRFDNAFVRTLPADPESRNFRRQVTGACYSHVGPTPVAQPRLLAYSREVAALLDLDPMAPILKMTLTAFTDLNEVVNYAQVFYRPDRYNHHGYLRRRRLSDHLTWTAVERIHGLAGQI